MGPPPGRSARVRQYRRRRLVALLILVAMAATVVGGVISGLRVLVDDDPAGAPALADTTTSSVVVTSTAAPAPTTTVGGPSQAPWSPTSTDPARVLIAGDSDAGAFGPPLLSALDETGVITPTLDYKVSSGLSRPDFFDWPTRFTERLAELDPHVVVVTFGGNDAQDLAVDGRSVPVADPAWTQAYRTRVRQVVDLLTADDRHLVWVGIPNASSEAFTARLEVQRDAVVAELAEHAAQDRIRYVDTWARFAGRSGGYADYIVDPRDGVGKKVRAADGFHLNMAGAEILATDIAAVVTQVLGVGQAP